MLDEVRAELDGTGGPRPHAIVIGDGGRVASGAADFCTAMGMRVTRWDVEETAHGGPFPEILAHELFLNCVRAQPGTPVFVPVSAVNPGRRLRVIGDISCDIDGAIECTVKGTEPGEPNFVYNPATG